MLFEKCGDHQIMLWLINPPAPYSYPFNKKCRHPRLCDRRGFCRFLVLPFQWRSVNVFCFYVNLLNQHVSGVGVEKASGEQLVSQLAQVIAASLLFCDGQVVHKVLIHCSDQCR